MIRNIREYWFDALVLVAGLVLGLGMGRIFGNPGIWISVLALPLSYVIAKRYGDVAAGREARKHAEEQALKARIIALKSLLYETKRAGKYALRNLGLVDVGGASQIDRAAIGMPVIAFETALFSKEPVLVGDSQDTPEFDALLEAVNEYLCEAGLINAAIDSRLAATAGGYIPFKEQHQDARFPTTREIYDRSKKIPAILGRVKGALERELKRASSAA